MAAGARIPAPLLKAVYDAADNDGVRQIGINWAASQVKDLMSDNVDGIHFYTLNSAPLMQELYEAI